MIDLLVDNARKELLNKEISIAELDEKLKEMFTTEESIVDTFGHRVIFFTNDNVPHFRFVICKEGFNIFIEMIFLYKKRKHEWFIKDLLVEVDNIYKY